MLILAAGLGTRLRPLTLNTPKPLVPVVDASILEQQMVKVINTFGKDNVMFHANAHYLMEQVVGEGKRLGFEKVWEEPEILGTAGPLRRIFQEWILKENKGGSLLVLNGDAYHGFNLMSFVENAQNSGRDFALLGVDFSKVNSLRVKDNSLVGVKGVFGEECSEKESRAHDNSFETCTFSGISWYSEKALARIEKEEFSIVKFWQKEFAQGRSPFVDVSQLHSTWIDMGSPEGLWAATEARLKELSMESWIHPLVEVPKGSRIEHAVVQDKVVIPANVVVENSILFEGASLLPGEFVLNEIRGKDFVWKI